MAGKARAFFRDIILRLDPAAARRVQEDTESALEKAGRLGGEEFERAMQAGGKKAGRALTSALEREYKVRVAQTRQQLAEGLINEAQFRREGEEAARAFNRGLTDGIKRLRTQGNSTDLDLANLTGRFKKPGGGAAGSVLGVLGSGMSAAGLGTAGAGLAVFSAIRESIPVADAYDSAVRKLGGTARLTGIELAKLEAFASGAKDQFKLATPVANDLTAEVVKLTQKAGDIEATEGAMRAFLDLGAARGLTAAQTLTAVGQSILGIDEGTDKLFGKNPSVLYEEYAARIGTTAAKLTDQEKAQALLDATLRAGELTRGEYANYLQSSAGQAEQNAKSIDEMRVAIGKASQPIREVGGWLKEVFYANLFAVTFILGGLLEKLGKLKNLGDIDLKVLINGRQPTNPGLGPNNSGDALQAFSERIAAGTAVDALGNPYKTPAQRQQEADQAEAKRREDAAAAAAQAAEVAKKRAEEHAASMAAIQLRAGWYEAQAASPTEVERLRAPGIIESVSVAARGPSVVEALDLDPVRGAFHDLWMDVANSSEEGAQLMSLAFQDAFDMMRQDGATVATFFAALGRGVGGALLGGLAQFAKGKVKENIAAAMEAAAYALGFTSHGNFGSAAAAWASSAKHGAAALAWGVASGAAGSGRSAMTGGAGGIPDSTRVAGLETFRNAERAERPIHIHLVGPGFHALNPQVQDVIHGALAPAIERNGMPKPLQIRTEKK